VKIHQYEAVVIEDRGHYTPSFMAALNDQGNLCGKIPCPICGENHAIANGWKLKEQQPMGSAKIVCLLEREIEIDNSCVGTLEAGSARETGSK
jgi:hypothetical protein